MALATEKNHKHNEHQPGVSTTLSAAHHLIHLFS